MKGQLPAMAERNLKKIVAYSSIALMLPDGTGTLLELVGPATKW